MLRTTLLAATAGLALIACTSDPSAPPSTGSPPVAPENTTTEPGSRWQAQIRIVWEGGRCQEGTCRTWLQADEADGTWQVMKQSDDEAQEGPAHPQAVRDVVSWVDSRWEELTAEPFQGTCPTAVDGEEMTVELSWLPWGSDAPMADADHRMTSSCVHAWPDGFEADLRQVWVDRGLPWPRENV